MDDDLERPPLSKPMRDAQLAVGIALFGWFCLAFGFGSSTVVDAVTALGRHDALRMVGVVAGGVGYGCWAGAVLGGIKAWGAARELEGDARTFARITSGAAVGLGLLPWLATCALCCNLGSGLPGVD